jgi:hypothetical protein
MVFIKPNLVHIIAMMHMLRLKHRETSCAKKFMWYIHYAHKKHLLNWATIILQNRFTIIMKIHFDQYKTQSLNLHD